MEPFFGRKPTLMKRTPNKLGTRNICDFKQFMEDTGIDSKLQSELSEISNSDKCNRTETHRCDQPPPTTTFNLNHHDPATTTTTTTTTITSTAITTSSTTANDNSNS